MVVWLSGEVGPSCHHVDPHVLLSTNLRFFQPRDPSRTGKCDQSTVWGWNVRRQQARLPPASPLFNVLGHTVPPVSDHLKGGAAVSGLDVKTLDILVVVVPPATILSRLGSAGAGRGGGVAADGNVFPDLGRFVDGIRHVPTCMFFVTGGQFCGQHSSARCNRKGPPRSHTTLRQMHDAYANMRARARARACQLSQIWPLKSREGVAQNANARTALSVLSRGTMRYNAVQCGIGLRSVAVGVNGKGAWLRFSGWLRRDDSAFLFHVVGGGVRGISRVASSLPLGLAFLGDPVLSFPLTMLSSWFLRSCPAPSFPGVHECGAARDAAPGFSRLVFVLEGVKAELDRQWAASVGRCVGAGNGWDGPVHEFCMKVERYCDVVSTDFPLQTCLLRS